MKKRSYKITASLREGYSGDGAHHTIKRANDTIVGWMKARILAGLPTISGLLTEGLLIFPSKGRRDDGELVTKAATVIFEGELSSLEDEARTDDEVALTLDSLADTLKTALGQEAVYIVFNKRNWAI